MHVCIHIYLIYMCIYMHLIIIFDYDFELSIYPYYMCGYNPFLFLMLEILLCLVLPAQTISFLFLLFLFKGSSCFWLLIYTVFLISNSSFSLFILSVSFVCWRLCQAVHQWTGCWMQGHQIGGQGRILGRNNDLLKQGSLRRGGILRDPHDFGNNRIEGTWEINWI
jgi:hypothetical protein